MSEQQQNQFITYEQLQRQYFIDLIALKRKKNHREVSQGESRRVVSRVVEKIQTGIFEIGEIQEKVEDLLEVKQLTEQQKKMIRNQKIREEKNRQNKLLYPKNKSLETFEQQQYPQNILSAEKHKQFIREIRMEKTKRQRKMSLLKQKELIHKQKSFTQSQKEQQQQRLQQIEKKKLKIQQNLQKMRQNHEKLLLNESQTKQLVNRIRKKKRLHQYLKQTYEQRYVLPLLQQQKKILEQRKEYSRLSLEQIQIHEKQYLEWKKSQQSLQKSNVSKNSYHPPPHSKKINMILAEQQRKKHTNQMQKQLIKQKIQRVHNYTSKLKQRQTHMPIVSKTIETSDRQKSQRTQISQRESSKRNNLGNKYLQEARKILRKRAKTQEGQKPLTITIDQRHSNNKQKTKSSNIIEIKDRQKSIQTSKKHQIQRLLNCIDLAPQQKLKRIQQADQILSIQLKKRQQKLKWRYNKKDNQSSVELMLATVRAKMNLLNYYQGVQS